MAKIIHLNTYSSGGAGNAAFRLHEGLRELGEDSLFAFKTGESDFDSASRSANTNYLSSLYGRISPSLEYHTAKWLWPRVRPVITRYLYPGNCRRLIRDFNPDIVHLHWIENNFVSLRDLGWIRKRGIPMVWTLHDMNPLTGGIGFRESCGLRVEPFGPLTYSDCRRPASETILRKRSLMLQSANITAVSPSRWLAAEAKLSPVFNGHPVRHIPYGINTSVFRPQSQEAARRHWDIPIDRKVILFGADAFGDTRKGFQHLNSALKAMASFSRTTEMPLVVAFGNTDALPTGLPDNLIRFVGRIYSHDHLSLLYSAADTFVCPSREDNLPNTIIESLACGTPVIGFKIGGLPDLIEDRINGRLITPFDESELAHAIQDLLGLPLDQLNHLRQSSRSKILQDLTLETQARSYLALYEEILSIRR